MARVARTVSKAARSAPAPVGAGVAVNPAVVKNAAWSGWRR
ncbi:hypothetical protein [Nocardia farcinica]